MNTHHIDDENNRLLYSVHRVVVRKGDNCLLVAGHDWKDEGRRQEGRLWGSINIWRRPGWIIAGDTGSAFILFFL